jgi:hypothetical protein
MSEPYKLTPEEEARINSKEDDYGFADVVFDPVNHKYVYVDDADRALFEQEEPTIECSKHGTQSITDSDTYTGFAGGGCYWHQLACGCHSVDESADVRAAE